jgi:transcriptional regulator with XRE-family HTH domain
MPRTRLHSYLRTERLASALTQAELGELLGLTKDAVSKYERGARPVSVKLLIASSIVFGKSPAELFPAVYDEIEDELAINALNLNDRFEHLEDPASRKKFDLVSGVPGRLREATNV